MDFSRTSGMDSILILLLLLLLIFLILIIFLILFTKNAGDDILVLERCIYDDIWCRNDAGDDIWCWNDAFTMTFGAGDDICAGTMHLR